MDIPGYYYDEEKKRYFRSPPEHLAYMMTDTPSKGVGSCTSNDSPFKVRTHSQHSRTLANAVPRSVFDLTARISSLRDPSSTLYYALPQTLVCSSRRHQLDNLKKRMHYDHCLDPPKFSHVMLNQSGNLVVSSVKLSMGPCQYPHFLVSGLYFVGPENRVKVLPATMEHLSWCESLSPNMSITEYRKAEIVMCCSKTDVMVCVCRPDRNREIDDVSQPHCRWTCKVSLKSMTDIDEKTVTTISLSEKVLGAYNSVRRGNIDVYELPDLKPVQSHTTPDKSSALSLLFRPSPLLLHAGTRSGTIVTWDLRSERYVSSTAIPNDSHDRAKPSVIQMHALDNNYLVANCLSSKLLLWDCKMNRQVFSYPRHANSYRPCQSCVDASQSVLAAVGEDKAIRVWSVWKGTLLRTIAETEYVTNGCLYDGELPAIAYNDHLGGRGGKPGLLIATHEGFTPFTI